jgi:hypothetical protein
LKEYCERAASLPPRDAEAHFQLGEWCETRGLEKEARRAFLQAIAIDADHAGARRKLGYSRYGTGWRIGAAGGSHTGKPVSRRTVDRQARDDGTAAAKASSTAPVTAVTGSGPEKSTSPEAGSEATPEARVVTTELERKKAWAEAAFKKFRAEMVTFEDGDFLIHTTHPSVRQPEVRALVQNLRQLKQDLIRFLGLPRSSVLWPDKLQFVLLRYQEEYGRFAEIADDTTDADRSPDNAYTKDGHTVLWKPDAEALPRRVGETALENLNGSDRWVGWWLTEGIAEVLVSQSPAGKARQHYRRSVLYAADYMKSKGDDLKIFSLLETPDYRDRERRRHRALALTLVDFLNRSKSGAFQKVVKALKSEEAPLVPAENSKEAFDKFYLDYISFQKETLESNYRAELTELDALWKKYVRLQAERLRVEPKDERDSKGQRGRRGGRLGL